MAAIPVAFVWNQWRPDAWSPLREMGFASLFVYWIHVEMAYGRPANAIKGELSFVEATIGYAILVCVLWGLVRLRGVCRCRRHLRAAAPCGRRAERLDDSDTSVRSEDRSPAIGGCPSSIARVACCQV